MNNLSDETKKKIVAELKTFAVSFIVGAGMILSGSEAINWTTAFWSSVLVAGLRAGLTSVIAPYLPIKLGGKKE